MQTRLVEFIVCHVCSGSLVLGEKRVVGLQVDISAPEMAISIRFEKSSRYGGIRHSLASRFVYPFGPDK